MIRWHLDPPGMCEILTQQEESDRVPVIPATVELDRTELCRSVEDIQLRSDHHISMMDKHRAQDRTGRIFYSDCANTVCWWLGQYLAVKTFYHLLQYDKPSTAENTGQYTQNSLKKMIYSVIIIFEILRFLWWSVTYVNNPFGIHLHVWPFVDCTQHSNKNK